MKKILIVDDDVAVTNYFKVFLKQTGRYDLAVVNDSREVIPTFLFPATANILILKQLKPFCRPVFCRLTLKISFL